MFAPGVVGGAVVELARAGVEVVVRRDGGPGGSPAAQRVLGKSGVGRMGKERKTEDRRGTDL